MNTSLLRPFLLTLALLTGLLGGQACRSHDQQQSDQTPPTYQSDKVQSPGHSGRHRHRSAKSTLRNSANTPIPDYVIRVLRYVQANRRAPDGYAGGRTFGNFERHLPQQDAAGQRLRYQEWDVKPKVRGRNRGAERLITGSDRHAYYTRDHYQSFTQIE
ncbi:hypothetical protein GCM10027578_32900 [Spirosoma luteolum]